MATSVKITTTTDIEIKSLVNSIGNDLTSGSTTIARRTVEAFFRAAELLSDAGRIGELSRVSYDFTAAKPSMAAIKNIIDYCIRLIESEEGNISYSRMASIVISRINVARQETIATALQNLRALYPSRCRLLTCSYSSAVLELIYELVKSGINTSAIILESAWQTYYYGIMLAEECNSRGIKTMTIKDTDIAEGILQSDCTVIGADALTADGGAVNGIPSLELASHSAGRIPFFVIAESFKSCDTAVVEDGFCYIPGEFITTIFSDVIL